MHDMARATIAARRGRPLNIDDDTLDIAARRNVLLGLWAAKVLGLRPWQREPYAWSVHFADFETPGVDEAVAKLSRDFVKASIAMSERRIAFQIREAELRAMFQLSVQPVSRRTRGSIHAMAVAVRRPR